MSQAVEQIPSGALASLKVANARPLPVEPGFDDFSYKSIPPLAPVSLLLGVSSLSGLLSPLGLLFALFGIPLGLVCLMEIRKSGGALGGEKLALSGTSLSTALLVGGMAWHMYLYQTEIPDGFQRVSFSQDIARKGFVIEDSQPRVHPDVAALNGQKLFVKGFMYPEGRLDGISNFILCRDNGQCCFGGQPKLTDMIRVKMDPGLTANFTNGMVSVAGIFRLRDLSQVGNLEPAYELEATHFGPALTSY